MDDLLTAKEAAEKLKIHINTLRRWSEEGKINSYVISERGDRRYKTEDLEIFLASASHNIEPNMMGTGNTK